MVWLIVVLVIVLISTSLYKINEKTNNDYSIFIPDVDGLIVGSPVRMMGIEVGYITKIKPTNDEVYVKFLIPDKTLIIPQGTQATVEFSGMAGSKSLELYLPDKNTYIDSSTPILTVNPPKRLHDALGLLSDMFDKLGSIITKSSAFSNKLNFIEIDAGSNQDVQEFLKYSNKLIDESNNKAEEIGRKLGNYGKQ